MACSSRVRAAPARSSTAAVPSSAAIRWPGPGGPPGVLEGHFERVSLVPDFREGGFGLRDAGRRGRLAPFGAGDLLFQLGVPRAAGRKLRRRAARFGSTFFRQGRLEGGVLGLGVAALGRQHGDGLLGLGQFTVERRQRGLRHLAGLLRGFLGFGHGQGGRRGRGGGRVFGAAAHRARDAGLQLGREFRGSVGQPFLAEIEPELAAVLVLLPGAAVAFGDGSALLPGRGVAPDQDQQFLRGGCLLCPQLHFGGEFLERRNPAVSASDSWRRAARAAAPEVRPSSSCARLRRSWAVRLRSPVSRASSGSRSSSTARSERSPRSAERSASPSRWSCQRHGAAEGVPGRSGNRPGSRSAARRVRGR